MQETHCESCAIAIKIFTNRIENTRFKNKSAEKFEYIKFDLCDTCYLIVSKKMVKKINELKTYYKN